MGTISNCQFGTIAGVGSVLIVIGAVFLGVWSELFDFIVRKQLVLTPTSYSYSLWEEVPIRMHLEFYLRHWTNPEELLDPTKKPVFVEKGPYVFDEYRKKVILSWNDNNDTNTFLQNRTWVFNQTLSGGSLNDPITTLNVPAATAVFALRNSTKVLQGLLNFAFGFLRTKLHVTKKAREFIFDGYNDPLMNLAALLPEGLVPITVPFDKFGWFYTRNDSAYYDGVFNMYTGKDDINKFAEMGQWNYENPTTIYESYCGMVNGSAGELFLPKPKKTSISLFSTDICRTLTLTYKENNIVDQIHSYRYWGDKYMFANLTSRPDNWCWCPSDECAPHGAIDVSTCKWGAPAFISFPHYLHGDPSYREAVVGINPIESKHQMFVDLEQRTGIPLQVEAALQINVLLEPHPEYKLFESVPKIYFPILWFREKAIVDEDIGATIRLVSRMPIMGYIFFGALLCIGIAMILVISPYYIDFRRKKRSEVDLKLVGS